MVEFRTVPATVVPVKISKGQDKWGECAKVEESGEDGQDQEKNLLALAWTTGSRQSLKRICFFCCPFATFHNLYFLPTMPVTKLGMGIQSPSQTLIVPLASDQ